ncbi:hypothetical protein FQA39_LY10452 [Lamprigera yunnana]|nr:hypothetical protein FQA39_LY10452 [Lamprigera yunnana]
MFRVIFVFYLVITNIYAFEILNDLSSCNQNSASYNNCLKNFINQLRSFIKNGNKELNLPSLNPLFIKKADVNHSSPGTQAVVKLRNLTYFNIYTYEVLDVESMGEKLIINAVLDNLPVVTDYYINGDLFNTAVKGEGMSFLIFKKVEAKFTITRRIMNLRGTNFCNNFEVNLNLTASDLAVIMTGLEPGPAGVSNEFLWENIKALIPVVTGFYGKVLEEFLQKRINGVCLEGYNSE